jgi:hypothetical protein
MTKLLQQLLDAGFVVSQWRNLTGARYFNAEVSKPEWGGSECESGRTAISALKKAAKKALEYDKG